MRISWNPREFLEIIEFSRIWGIVKGFAIAEWRRTPFGHRKSDRLPAPPENTVHVSNPEQVPEQKPRPYFSSSSWFQHFPPLRDLAFSLRKTQGRDRFREKSKNRSRFCIFPWTSIWPCPGNDSGDLGRSLPDKIPRNSKDLIIFHLFATLFFVKSPGLPDGRSL